MRYLIIMLVMLATVAHADPLAAYWASVNASAGEPPPTESTYLRAWLRFNSGDGSIQQDSSGYNTFVSQTNASMQGIISNSALYMDGNDYMRTTNTAFLNGCTQALLTAWINVNALESLAGIWGSVAGTGSNRSGLQFEATPGKKVYGIISAADSARYILSGNDVTLSNWVFVATYFSSGKTLGVVVDSTFTTKAIGANNLLVNTPWNVGLYANNDAQFAGFIDDCRAYDFSGYGASFTNAISNIVMQIKNEGRR